MRKLAITLLLLLLSTTAWAETVRFDGQREDHSFHATGQDIEVHGQYNDIDISGEAGTVTIFGQYNDVNVDSARAIVFKGHYNDVNVASGSPKISDYGSHNDVVGLYDGKSNVNIVKNGGVEGGGVSDDAIVLNGAGVVKTYPGEGRNFVINGASNKVTITGQAGSVTVNGSTNVVHVDQAISINASGFGNTVTFSSGSPSISRSGVNVTVKKR